MTSSQFERLIKSPTTRLTWTATEIGRGADGNIIPVLVRHVATARSCIRLERQERAIALAANHCPAPDRRTNRQALRDFIEANDAKITHKNKSI